MGLIAVLLVVGTLVPATALLLGGLHLVRRPSRVYGLGVAMLVLGSLWALLGVLAVVAVVQPLL